jgi:IS5 family transposase
MGSKQLGFGDYEQTEAKRCTKREKFLADVVRLVPWQALIETLTMHRCVGIYMIDDRIPSEAAILPFQHLLEKHNLGGADLLLRRTLHL